MSFSRLWFPDSSSHDVQMPSPDMVSVRASVRLDESGGDIEGSMVVVRFYLDSRKQRD